MISKIKPLGLSLSSLMVALSASVLPGCHSGDESLSNNGAAEIGLAPHRTGYVNHTVYSTIRSDSDANNAFDKAGSATVGTEPCAVKLHKMSYKTVDSIGAETTSTGVFMLPEPHAAPHPLSAALNPTAAARCSGDRPVVLYAHGTWFDRSMDLSQFIADSDNPASGEAVMLLAFYASRGYAVIAPNYAGYADSPLSHHPYINEKQQTTEMINALDHVRSHASTLGASFSDKLFVTGVSQGGYVAMATHKALEDKGETVTASMPISGPYAMLTFLDTVMGGTVNGGSTVFSPMYLTALDRAHDIYDDDPDEVFSTQYASVADNVLPRPGGYDTVADLGLPEALFNIAPDAGLSLPTSPPVGTPGYSATDYLLSDNFRKEYLDDKAANANNPVFKVRKLTKDLDLSIRGWKPNSKVAMCGASNDPVVFHPANSAVMAGALGAVSADVQNIDLNAPATTSTDYADDARTEWQSIFPAPAIIQTLPLAQQAGILGNVHAATGFYCTIAGMNFFDDEL